MLSTQATTSIQQAKTPEEAYKIFAGAVAAGLGTVMADALAKALGTVSMAAANPATAGWESYVTGMIMHVDFSTPGNNMPTTVLNTFATGMIGTAAAPHILGGSVTIGCNWSF